ncbi:MAG: hypothetical protein AB3N28_10670, partial [Kordiimonas sp.]
MLKQTLVLGTMLSLISSVQVQAGTTRGGVALLEMCPGDTVTAPADTPGRAEGLFLSLLTPLLTKGVSMGLNAVGTKLNKAAQEADVDFHRVGGHFFTATKKNENAIDGSGAVSYGMRSACIVVASKGTNSKSSDGRNFGNLTSGYRKFEFGDDVYSDGSADLVKQLEGMGFSAAEDVKTLPGLVAVFQVETSSVETEFRLVPRFVAVDHSIREKKADRKARTFTFETNYLIPGQDNAAEGHPIKIGNLVIGQPFTQEMGEGASVSSRWLPMPKLDASVTSHVKSIGELKGKLGALKAAGALSAASAARLGYVAIAGNSTCRAPNIHQQELLDLHGKLSSEQVKASPSTQLVARYTQAKAFHQSCFEQAALKNQIGKKVKGANSLARSYDLEIKIKEFRSRPFVKCLGELLSDEDTQGKLKETIVNAIDPATRQAAAKTAAEA